MRILQVVTDTDRRGAQVFAVQLEADLRRRGRTVRTVALAPGTTGGLDLPVLGPTRRSIRTMGGLVREARRADVLVGHGSTTLPLCAVVGALTHRPFVYRQISDSLFWASTAARRARVRAALGRAARVVSLWSGAARTLGDHFGVGADRLRVIPNGVPAELFSPPTDDERRAARRHFGIVEGAFVVVYVGALVSEKGVDVALDSVAHLAGVELMIVGDGPERAALERRVPAGARRFVGSLDDPSLAYAAADVMVFPSRGGDSMPAVVIEAGLAGLPVIATPIGAIEEVVVDSITGLIVPVDDVTALRGAIHSLARDPVRSRAMGDAARVHCTATYSMTSVGAAWDAVLAEV